MLLQALGRFDDWVRGAQPRNGRRYSLTRGGFIIWFKDKFSPKEQFSREPPKVEPNLTLPMILFGRHKIDPAYFYFFLYLRRDFDITGVLQVFKMTYGKWDANKKNLMTALTPNDPCPIQFSPQPVIQVMFWHLAFCVKSLGSSTWAEYSFESYNAVLF